MAISRKTASEITTLCPEAKVVVIENGRDHPRRWSILPRSSREGPHYLVTFGHKNHKRPELAIAALTMLDGDPEDTKLIVLGAEGSYRHDLEVLAHSFGVSERCEFPGFVNEQEYQSIVSNAKVLLLLSSDDGFGLPLVEAEYFGIPAIVMSDSGLAALHPSVIETEPVAAELARAICVALPSEGLKPLTWTWSDTVHKMRGVMGPTDKSVRRRQRMS
jgi:glycosyltransferase involved in cell wall biosynthesis